MAQPTADAEFDIEVDEEGVCRVLHRDPGEMMSFTVRDFGRFLTEFVCAVTRTEDEE